MVRAVSSAETASFDSLPARPMEVEPRHGEAGPRRRVRRSLMSRRCDPDRSLSASREERRQAVQRLPSIHSAEGQVVRSPRQLKVAHLDVGDLVGVEIHLGQLREDEVQELGAVETADLGVEVELLDYVAGVGPLCPQGSRAIISFTNAVPAGTFCPSLTSGH